MQTPPVPTSARAWTDSLGWLVAIIVTLGNGIGWTYNAIRNRRKPAVEIHESETRSDLNVAQVKHLELQDNLTAGELLSRIFQQLFEANKRSDQLLSELEAAKRDVGRIPALEQECKLLAAQVQRARAQGFLAHDQAGTPNPAA